VQSMSRSSELRHLMVEECTADWMTKMNKKHECVRHMAFVAPAGTSVADLSAQCSAMNQNFLIEDARELCQGLSAVHEQFWQRFHK